MYRLFDGWTNINSFLEQITVPQSVFPSAPQINTSYLHLHYTAGLEYHSFTSKFSTHIIHIVPGLRCERHDQSYFKHMAVTLPEAQIINHVFPKYWINIGPGSGFQLSRFLSRLNSAQLRGRIQLPQYHRFILSQVKLIFEIRKWNQLAGLASAFRNSGHPFNTNESMVIVRKLVRFWNKLVLKKKVYIK